MKPFDEQTHYEVLEVEPDATLEEIRRSYGKLREVFAPEAIALYSLVDQQEHRALLDRLEEAFLVLSDERARGAYDERHGFGKKPEPARPAPRPGPAAQLTLPEIVTAVDVAPAWPGRGTEPAPPEAEPDAAPLRRPVDGLVETPPRPEPRATPEAEPAPLRRPVDGLVENPPRPEPRAIPELEPAPLRRPVDGLVENPPRPEARTAPAPAPLRRPVDGLTGKPVRREARGAVTPAPLRRPVDGLVMPPPRPEPRPANGEADLELDVDVDLELEAPPATGIVLARPAAAPAPRPPMPELDPATEYSGALLRQIREARGLSLRDLAARTRISLGHLENLEAETFAKLPERVYLRGFLAAYAREFKLDPARVVDSYLGRRRS